MVKQMNLLDTMLHCNTAWYQDRAVTSDYETLVKSIYPNALSVGVGVVKMMKHQDTV